MLEPQFLNRVFELPFHLGIEHHALAAAPCAGDEDVCLDAGILRCFGEGEVQLEVDFALVCDAACGGAGRAESAEEDVWRWGGGERRGPGEGVGVFEGLKFGRGGGEGFAGVGEDDGEGWVPEEGGEDVRALRCDLELR